MKTSKNSGIPELCEALMNDLNKARPQQFSPLVYEPARKLFRTKKESAVFEFDLRQPESDYWNGKKIYPSGKQSRVRFPRSKSAVAVA